MIGRALIRYKASTLVAPKTTNPPRRAQTEGPGRLLAGCQSRASWRAGAGQRMTAVPVAMAASMPLLVPAVK